MRKDNTQNYQTSNTRIQHFSDYTDNPAKEKEELKSVKRSYVDNEDQIHNLPNVSKYKYNKVSNKMDDVSQDQIKDRIEAIEDEEVKAPSHKYRISEHIRTFEGFDGGIDAQNPPNVEPYRNGTEEEEIEDTDFSDEMVDDDGDDYYAGDKEHQQNYMFFGNLETMKRMIDELLEMDRDEIDNILTDGHDWAEDHITRAKENIQQVHNFLKTEFE